MPQLTPELQRVRNLVRAAFDEVPRPKEADIALHDCSDCAELRSTFARYDWPSLPASVIEAHASSLPLLGPLGLVHYLPAYLFYALEHFTHLSLPTEMLIYTLTPSEEYEHEDWRLEHLRDRFKYFTAPQISAVNEFLLLVEGDETFRVHLGDVGPGRRRLLRVWEQRWAS